MTNSRILVAGLQDYLFSLDRHLHQLRLEYLKLERAWHNFSTVAEGDYADQFRGGWQKTQAQFKDYLDRTQAIKLLLQERIEDLYRFDRGEDLNISFSSNFSSSQTFSPPSQPSSPPSPKPKSGVSEFAKNLRYDVNKIGTGTLRITVYEPINNTEIGYLDAGKLEGNRIEIRGIQVADKYQSTQNPETKGIGTMLFKKLQEQSPDRAEFYFEENQAEEFWAKIGFQTRKIKIREAGQEKEKIEYFKINSKTP